MDKIHFQHRTIVTLICVLSFSIGIGLGHIQYQHKKIISLERELHEQNQETLFIYPHITLEWHDHFDEQRKNLEQMKEHLDEFRHFHAFPPHIQEE